MVLVGSCVRGKLTCILCNTPNTSSYNGVGVTCKDVCKHDLLNKVVQRSNQRELRERLYLNVQ